MSNILQQFLRFLVLDVKITKSKTTAQVYKHVQATLTKVRILNFLNTFISMNYLKIGRTKGFFILTTSICFH
jgi:hypothetical protein